MVGAHLVGNGIQGPDIWRDFGAEAITVDEKVPVRGSGPCRNRSVGHWVSQCRELWESIPDIHVWYNLPTFNMVIWFIFMVIVSKYNIPYIECLGIGSKYRLRVLRHPVIPCEDDCERTPLHIFSSSSRGSKYD